MNAPTIVHLIAETGDHPLAGMFCPGQHREPWTVERVRSDAMAGLRQSSAPGPAGEHRRSRVRLLNLTELLAADQLLTELWLASLVLVRLPEAPARPALTQVSSAPEV